MKQKLCNWGKEVLLVEVPEDAKGLSIWEATMSLRGYKKGDLFLGYISDGESYNDPLPPSNWKLAFASPLKPTEQEAGEWVETVSGWSDTLYYDYCKPQSDYRDIIEAAHRSPIASLASRIRSEGFEPERTIVLVKL